MKWGKRAAEFAATGWDIIDIVSGVGGIFVTNILVFLWYPFIESVWWVRLLYGVEVSIFPFCFFALLSKSVRWLVKTHATQIKDSMLKAVLAVKTSIATLNQRAPGSGIVTIDPVLTAPKPTIIPRLEGKILCNRVLLEVHNDDVREAHEFAVRLCGITGATRPLQTQLPISLGWDDVDEKYRTIGPGQFANLDVIDARDIQLEDASSVRHLVVNKFGTTIPELGTLYPSVPFPSELRFQVEVMADVPIAGNRFSEWTLSLSESGGFLDVRRTLPMTLSLGNTS